MFPAPAYDENAGDTALSSEFTPWALFDALLDRPVN